jgi:two-component system response regulator AtoC
MRDEETETLRWQRRRPRLLAVWEGGSSLRPLPDRGTLVVGRGDRCDLRIDHRSVSREHAAIHVGPGDAVSVEDLGSSNGTRVRGRALDAHVPTAVAPGEIVEVGAARVLLDCPDSGRRDDGARPSDEPMGEVDRLVELVAPSEIGVLLCGETGVGKEVIAEKIHRLSPRAPKPLVRLNCAALSDSLLESELFGHEKGAFTGAVASKPGLLETGNGGTVFLDEVAEMPVATQAKLLRAVESRELFRVGGTQPRSIDVRFVAATNRDLPDLCDAGAFRSDLYFRLNVITITVPPLRERVASIRVLADELVARQCSKTGRAPPALSPEAVAHLEGYAWPGNVRELRNVVERALVLCPGATIGPQHLLLDAAGPRSSRAPPPSAPAETAAPPSSRLHDQIEALERQRVVEALDRFGGNQTKAARLLGISRRTLLARLDAWGLPRPRK